jgi:hypothetical protein
MRHGLRLVGRLFDALQARWTSVGQRHLIGSVLVAVFLFSLAGIEAARRGWLPAPLATLIPRNHFHAVDVAFTLLLVFEVIALVFSLAESVSLSVGMQFEIFSLILLRQTFKEFTTFSEPVVWTEVQASLLPMASDAVGALLIFAALTFYYRLQRHQPITRAEDRTSFVDTKKAIALGLLAVFVAIGATDAWYLATGRGLFPFFEAFYTVLIFSDVLLVLISMRHSADYRVLFRNSGFAVATVFVRLALTAPPVVNAALGLGAVIFACGLTVSYNAFLAHGVEAQE